MDDIKPATPNESQLTNTTSEPVAQNSNITSMNKTQVDDPLLQPQTQNDQKPIVTNETMETNLPVTPIESSELFKKDEVTILNAANAKKKHGKLPLMIALVVVIVLALSAVAYLAFMQDNGNEINSTDSTQSTTTNTDTSSDDPSAVSDSIDNSLKSIDDDSDYSTSDLSDTTIGL